MTIIFSSNNEYSRQVKEYREFSRFTFSACVVDIPSLFTVDDRPLKITLSTKYEPMEADPCILYMRGHIIYIKECKIIVSFYGLKASFTTKNKTNIGEEVFLKVEIM